MFVSSQSQKGISSIHHVAVHQQIGVMSIWSLTAIQLDYKEHLTTTKEQFLRAALLILKFEQ